MNNQQELFSKKKLTPRAAYREIQSLGFIDGLYKHGYEPNERYIVCLPYNHLVEILPEEYLVRYFGEFRGLASWTIWDKDRPHIRMSKETITHEKQEAVEDYIKNVLPYN